MMPALTPTSFAVIAAVPALAVLVWVLGHIVYDAWQNRWRGCIHGDPDEHDEDSTVEVYETGREAFVAELRYQATENIRWWAVLAYPIGIGITVAVCWTALYTVALAVA